MRALVLALVLSTAALASDDAEADTVVAAFAESTAVASRLEEAAGRLDALARTQAPAGLDASAAELWKRQSDLLRGEAERLRTRRTTLLLVRKRMTDLAGGTPTARSVRQHFDASARLFVEQATQLRLNRDESAVAVQRLGSLQVQLRQHAAAADASRARHDNGVRYLQYASGS